MKVSTNDIRIMSTRAEDEPSLSKNDRKRKFDIFAARQGLQTVPISVISLYAQELMPVETLMDLAMRFSDFDAFKKAIERGHGVDYVYNPGRKMQCSLAFSLVGIGVKENEEIRREFVIPALRFIVECGVNLSLPMNYEHYQRTVVLGKPCSMIVAHGRDVMQYVGDICSKYLATVPKRLKKFAKEAKEILGLD